MGGRLVRHGAAGQHPAGPAAVHAGHRGQHPDGDLGEHSAGRQRFWWSWWARSGRARATGCTCYLLAAVGAIVRAYRRVALERLIAAVALGLIIVVSGADYDGLVLLIAVDLGLLVMLAREHFRVEVRHRDGDLGAGNAGGQVPQ